MWCFAALELTLTQTAGIQSRNLQNVSTENVKNICCKFVYIWYFLKMPFSVMALFKSRACISEFPLLYSPLWLLRGGECHFPLHFCSNKRVDICIDVDPGIHLLGDESHRDRVDVVTPTLVSHWVKHGPFFLVFRLHHLSSPAIFTSLGSLDSCRSFLGLFVCYHLQKKWLAHRNNYF